MTMRHAECRSLRAREHEPERENQEDDGELHRALISSEFEPSVKRRQVQATSNCSVAPGCPSPAGGTWAKGITSATEAATENTKLNPAQSQQERILLAAIERSGHLTHAPA